MLNTISIFCRPLRSTTIIGAVTVACSPPSQFAVRRSFFTTARCDAIPKPLNIPLPPNSCAPNAEVAKLFNTTKPDVMQDLTTDSTNPLPSTVDLKNTKKWKCTVYQFESCPFCRKARACLDYLGIPYTVVETHPLSKKELKPITDYRKVPVLVISQIGEDVQYILKDSKRIVHILMSHEGKATPISDKERKERELQWIQWSDDVLVQLIVMNIYRSIKESAETFAYLLTHPQYSFFERYIAQISGTFVMWLVSKRRKAKYQISDERQALYDAIEEFLHAKGSNPFHGGSEPNEADVNVYGILRSIEGFSCEKDVKQNTRYSEWMDAMQKLSSVSCAKNSISRGPSKT